MGLVPLYRPINPIHMNPPIHQSNAWEGCSPLLEGEPDSPEGEPEGAAEFLLYTHSKGGASRSFFFSPNSLFLIFQYLDLLFFHLVRRPSTIRSIDQTAFLTGFKANRHSFCPNCHSFPVTHLLAPGLSVYSTRLFIRPNLWNLWYNTQYNTIPPVSGLEKDFKRRKESWTINRSNQIKSISIISYI